MWISCGFCEISKNTFFAEHLRTTASTFLFTEDFFLSCLFVPWQSYHTISILFFLSSYIHLFRSSLDKHQRFFANSVKHLRWSFLRKQITAKYSSIFLQKIFIIYIPQIPKYATYEIQKETGNHLISMYAKLSVKLTISYPLIRTRRWTYQRVRNVSFSGNFAYVLN